MDCILDVDTGVDDALALLLALRSPSLNVLAVTTVSGNVGVGAVLDNTLRVLDAAGARADLPVARGCDRPLVSAVHHCPQIHGEDGLGDLQQPLPPSARRASPLHAVELLLSTLRAVPAGGTLTVIALAPLTNVAMLVRLAPELCRQKLRVAWMGGAAYGGGNASQWAEANAAYDPEAAAIVLGADGADGAACAAVSIYTWDAYKQVELSEAQLLALAGEADLAALDAACDGEREFADAALPSWTACALRLLRGEMRKWKATTVMIGDAGAVAALLAPEAEGAMGELLHVVVELAGTQTRGMTVVDARPFVMVPDRPKGEPNVSVISKVDGAALGEVFLKALGSRE